MPRGSALRYSSVAAMPDGIRAKVEAQGRASRRPATKPPTAAVSRSTARKPRRDEEHNEQVVFINRIRTLAMNDVRYAVASRRTHAIPNGGGRSKREGGRLKAEGVVVGVPDIFCSVARGGKHGLYIEMKSLTGSASREQAAWISESIEEGYAAEVCRGADVAFKVWREYVDAGMLA